MRSDNVLAWPAKPKPVEEPKPPGRTGGEIVYEVYRQERVRQGWEEFLWKSLDPQQRLVWQRVFERLNKGDV